MPRGTTRSKSTKLTRAESRLAAAESRLSCLRVLEGVVLVEETTKTGFSHVAGEASSATNLVTDLGTWPTTAPPILFF